MDEEKKKYSEDKKKVTKKEQKELDKKKEFEQQQVDEVAEAGKLTLAEYQRSKKKVELVKKEPRRVV